MILKLIILSFLAINITTSTSKAVIFIDSFTEYLSGHCKEYCKKNGINIIECVSPYIQTLLASQGNIVPESLLGPNNGEEVAWAESVELFKEDMEVESDCIALSESDAGVSLAANIQMALKLRGNGDMSHIRNKYLLNERIRQNGLPAVKQQLARSMKDVESFVSVQLNWDIDLDDDVIQETSCVMKPYIGVASDGVYKCKSRKELEKAFADLYQHPRYGGGINDAVLLQEYLSGTEYAVDTVSRNGETKILALWKYKKYPLNVAPFVYQCSEIVSSAQLNEQKVCEYCLEVLKAAGIKWGPTHTEVMLTKDGPRLIEVNARWHAQNFKPITDCALGYDSLTTSIDAAFFPQIFDELPARPDILKSEGVIVHLISLKEGVITKINHLDRIKNLQSVIYTHLEYQVKDKLVKTVDIRTDCGYILLAHKDRKVLEDDYETIVNLQPTLFEVQDDINTDSFYDVYHEQFSQIAKDFKLLSENKICDDDDDGENEDDEVEIELMEKSFEPITKVPFEFVNDPRILNQPLPNSMKLDNQNNLKDPDNQQTESEVLYVPAVKENVIFPSRFNENKSSHEGPSINTKSWNEGIKVSFKHLQSFNVFIQNLKWLMESKSISNFKASNFYMNQVLERSSHYWRKFNLKSKPMKLMIGSLKLFLMGYILSVISCLLIVPLFESYILA